MKSDLPLNLKARTIDEVIHSLNRIIAWSKENKYRLGYFPALYRKVTIRVKTRIDEGAFADGKRMERLDVNFANRYLEAFEQYHSSKDLTLSWRLAFDSSKRWRPVVLQHLLTGMNAHIALDLGIAAAQTADKGKLEDLKGDFFKINNILVSLINEVQEELARVWPLLKLLDYAAGEADEYVAKFGMTISRGHAWNVAKGLSDLAPQDRIAKIAELDREVLKISKIILNPGYRVRAVLLLIRLGEIRSVPRIIEMLE